MRRKFQYRRLFISVGTILLGCLLFTQYVKCENKDATSLSSKRMLRVKQEKRQGNGATYFEITLISQKGVENLVVAHTEVIAVL